MAVQVDYNNDNDEYGIYGAYNPFIALISWFGVSIYNVSYQVKVTALNDSTVVEKTVFPTMGTYAQVNPLTLVKDTFFKSEYNGSTEHSQPYSYSQIRVEIGISYSSTASTPPTFAGYTLTDTFYVYNGYEQPPQVLNYRNPNWYDTLPIKLPKVKKTLYLLEDDIELLSFPSKFTGNFGGSLDSRNATDLVTGYYDIDDNLISENSIDLTVRPDLTGVAYWNININSIFPANTYYSKIHVTYAGGEGVDDSEQITIYRSECNPKQDRYRVYWVNRDGGAEYQNFTLRSDVSYQSNGGKIIQSDGINYKATSFDDIKDINNPNLQEFGKSSTKMIKLRTDYFNEQEEIDALSELFKSSVVIMFDADNTAYPMLVKTNGFEIGEIKHELVKAEIDFQYANNELIQIQ